VQDTNADIKISIAIMIAVIFFIFFPPVFRNILLITVYTSFFALLPPGNFALFTIFSKLYLVLLEYYTI
ncbi:MAG: hypothetical protein IJX51_08895, partial [Clostridia bacterium]|nr:hypothetical protein [Clostridia bacterium]